MNRFNHLVVKARGQALGIRKRQLKLACQFVHSHYNSSNFMGRKITPGILWI
jgi:hypothetical protein